MEMQRRSAEYWSPSNRTSGDTSLEAEQGMTPADSTPPPTELRRAEGIHFARPGAYGRTGRIAMLELEVERLATRVKELERERDQVEAFAAVAAHELVEPLVMTEAYTSIISSRLEAPEHAGSRADLQALGRAVARLRLLTESVLHEARSQAHQLERRPVAVDALVADCLALLAPEIDARNARLQVDELPDAHADEALLGGVFTNLLVNALKYSPRRGAQIRVGGTEASGGPRYFVDSEGPTIAEDDRERIFDTFQRGRDERRAHGAGLGLSICRRIVARHGGVIGVEPAAGGGNRFFFTMPTC
jgi:signal transduction histidine kinase